MGKSSKKAAAVAAAAPAAEVLKGKAGKKRVAVGEIEKAASAKKKKAAPPPPKGAGKKVKKQPPTKKVESSSSSSSEEEPESKPEEEVQTKKAAKPVKEVSSDGNSEVSSESDEEPAASLKKPSVTGAKKEEPGSSGSDSDDDSDEDSAPDAKIAKKDISSGEEDDEEDDSEDESDEEEPPKTPKKDPGHASEKQTATKEPKTPASPQSQATGSNVLFMGNAPYDADLDKVKDFFKEAGEVIDVRFPLRRQDGKRKPYCLIEFASVEAAQKAIAFNGREFMSRPVKLDFAVEKGTRTPQSGNDTGSFQKPARGSSLSVFIRGFDKSLAEDKIRSSLEQHFAECGEVTRVSIPIDNQSGTLKGIAYMDFKDQKSLSKALELSASDLGGCELFVDQANPRVDNRGGGGGRSGGGGGGRFGGRKCGRSGGRGKFGGRNSGRGGRG